MTDYAEPPQPPALPALVRELAGVTAEHTSAVVNLAGSDAAPSLEGRVGLVHAGFFEAELPVLDRGWYAGARWGYEGAHLPGRPAQTFFASPEVWWRGAKSGPGGVGAGGALGFALPMARDLDEDQLKVFRLARVVRPADSVLFQDRTLVARPALDLRYAAMPWLFQLRQGVDAVIRLADTGSIDFVAHGAVMFGYRPSEAWLVGFELRDVYLLTEDLPDDRRAAVSAAAAARVQLHRVAPSLELEIPIATPLGGEARSFFAVRLGLVVDLPEAGVLDR